VAVLEGIRRYQRRWLARDAAAGVTLAALAARYYETLYAAREAFHRAA